MARTMPSRTLTRLAHPCTALGASDSILEMYKLGWEGHLLQYTEAKTVEVPIAREGMYYKEFSVMFDWFHHGEGLAVFNFAGVVGSV